MFEYHLCCQGSGLGGELGAVVEMRLELKVLFLVRTRQQEDPKRVLNRFMRSSEARCTMARCRVGDVPPMKRPSAMSAPPSAPHMQPVFPTPSENGAARARAWYSSRLPPSPLLSVASTASEQYNCLLRKRFRARSPISAGTPMESCGLASTRWGLYLTSAAGYFAPFHAKIPPGYRYTLVKPFLTAHVAPLWLRVHLTKPQ